jgi:hypothetical protein
MNDAHPIPPPADGAPPPPPPVVVRSAFPTGAVIALACIGVLFVVGVGAGVFAATRRLHGRSLSSDPNAPLTQQYTPQTGFFTAHYPSDFAVRMESGSVVLARRGLLDDEEVVVVTAVDHPISDDARELARVMEVAFRKKIEAKGFRVMGGDLRPAKCPTSGALHDGIEIIDMYWMIKSAEVTAWSCTFLEHGRGYKLTYLLPRARITEERPLLERIVGATELKQ